MPGLVGHTVAVDVASATLWTVSAWVDRGALARFERSAAHRAAKNDLREFLAPFSVRGVGTAPRATCRSGGRRSAAGSRTPRVPETSEDQIGATMLTTYLLGGFVNATALVIVAFLLSRFAGEIYGHGLLAIVLFIAGGVYVGFAVAAGATGFWFLAEFLQAIALGVLGLPRPAPIPLPARRRLALHPRWTSSCTTSVQATSSPPRVGLSPASASTYWSPPTSRPPSPSRRGARRATRGR